MENLSQDWRKSSYSGNGGAECVEVASGERGIAIRDSKDPNGPVLSVPASGWHNFIAAVGAGRHGG